jgi:hypothetical protein
MPHSILRSVGAPARKTRRRVDADPLNALAADIALPQAFLRHPPLGEQYLSRIEEPITMMHMVPLTD